jgi:hypothetical protein
LLFYFPVSYSIDESVGGLRLNVVGGKPNKGPVGQLFDGRSFKLTLEMPSRPNISQYLQT